MTKKSHKRNKKKNNETSGIDFRYLNRGCDDDSNVHLETSKKWRHNHVIQLLIDFVNNDFNVC